MSQHNMRVRFGTIVDEVQEYEEEHNEETKKICLAIFIFAGILLVSIIGLLFTLQVSIPYFDATPDESIYFIILYFLLISCVTLFCRHGISGIILLFPLTLLFLYLISLYTHLESYFYLSVIITTVIFLFVLRYLIPKYPKELLELANGDVG